MAGEAHPFSTLLIIPNYGALCCGARALPMSFTVLTIWSSFSVSVDCSYTQWPATYTVGEESLASENACSHSAAGPSQQQVPLSVISQGLMLCHLAFCNGMQTVQRGALQSEQWTVEDVTVCARDRRGQ